MNSLPVESNEPQTSRKQREAGEEQLHQALSWLLAGASVGLLVWFAAFYVSAAYAGLDSINWILGPIYDPPGWSFQVPIRGEPLFEVDCSGIGYLDGKIRCPHHYFGDFSAAVELVQTGSPWNQQAEHPYFPLTPSLIFGLIGILPYDSVFLIFQGATVVALTLPIVIAVWRFSVPVRVTSVVLLGILTWPVLYTLDRGNPHGFVILGLFSFVLLIKDKRWLLAAVVLVLIIAIKIHALPLVLLFIAFRKWKFALLVPALALLLALILWRLWPESSLSSLRGMLSTFGGMASAPTASFDYLWRSIGVTGFLSGAGVLFDLPELRAWVASHTSILVALTALLFYPVLLVRSAPAWAWAVAAGAPMVLGVPRGYGYGATFIVAVVALFLMGRRWNEMSFERSKVLLLLFVFAVTAINMLDGFPVFVPEGATADQGGFTIKTFTVPIASAVLLVLAWIEIRFAGRNGAASNDR